MHALMINKKYKNNYKIKTIPLITIRIIISLIISYIIHIIHIIQAK